MRTVQLYTVSVTLLYRDINTEDLLEHIVPSQRKSYKLSVYAISISGDTYLRWYFYDDPQCNVYEKK
jgi:hypothetical protein